MPYNLTNEQLAALGQVLTTPPPESVAPQRIDSTTLLAAQAGLLGQGGRFIDQLSRQQQFADTEASQIRATQEINSIHPLDKDYYRKLAEVQNRYGPVFASRPVQQAITIGERQRTDAESAFKEQEKEQQKVGMATVKQAIRQSSPEERQQLRAENPLLASELDADLEAQDKREFEAATLAESVPEHLLEGVDKRNPLAVKKVATTFRNSLPPALKKIDNVATLNEVVDLAGQYKALKDKVAKNTLTEEEQPLMGSILSQLKDRGVDMDDPSGLAGFKEKLIDQRQKYNPRAKALMDGLD